MFIFCFSVFVEFIVTDFRTAARTLFGVNQLAVPTIIEPEPGLVSRPKTLPEIPVVEFSPGTSEEELKHVTKFDYWSIGNLDEISKWLFPVSFVVWNIVYFLINFLLSGRG